MLKIITIISIGLILLSCTQKTPNRLPQEQIRSSEKAFEELEREVEKEFKGGSIKSEEKKVGKIEKRIPYGKKPKVRSKYPMKNGYPVWFWNPYYGGVLGAVGIVKVDKDKNLIELKRVARLIAISKLAKAVEVNIYTETERREIRKELKGVYERYKKFFSKYSRHQVKNVIIKNAVVKDEWFNPETGEYMVWVIIEPK